MSENNDIIKELGLPPGVSSFRLGGVDVPFDPKGAVLGGRISTEAEQSSVRDRVVRNVSLASIGYDTLPLYGEAMLLAVISDYFTMDPHFIYFPGDPARSRVILTTQLNREMIAGRDKKPIVCASFEEASARELVLGNTMTSAGPDAIPHSKKSVMETLTFSVQVLHHNRNLCLFMGQSVRALLVTGGELMKAAFNLQKTYPPTLRRPVKMRESEDVFICSLMLRVDAMPQWHIDNRPEYISRIIATTIAMASGTVESIIQEEGLVVEASSAAE